MDVITAAAVRMPDTREAEKDNGVGGKVRLRVYDEETDREMMQDKVRMVLQVALDQGITHLVLGAWGCGAYGNPPEEVAKIFKKAISGDRRRPWHILGGGIEELVFAIFDEGENLKVFNEVFADVMWKGGDEDDREKGSEELASDTV
jgi:uncharacterized protein (TIGR02452 family)